MKIMRASDMVQERPTLKILTYGMTGSGKTTWAAKSPMPLVIATEPQSVPSIQSANPDAMVLCVDSWEEFKSAWGVIAKSKPIKLENGQAAAEAHFDGQVVEFQTVVLDSLSDLQQRMIESLTGADKSTAKSLQMRGGPQLTLPQWGQLQGAMGRILRSSRSIPANVIFICLASEQYDDKQVRRVVPLLSGKKTVGTIGQFFNAVGYQAIDNDGNHAICWQASNRFISKPAPGFPGVTSGSVELGDLLLQSYPNASGVAHSPSNSVDNVIDSRQKK